MLIDGEIVALDHDGVPDFSALQAAIADGKTSSLIFFAFDLLFAGGEDLRALPLVERKARLKQLLERRKGKARLIRYVEHFDEGGETRTAIGQQMSLEGIISKKLDAPYRSGRSESWTKAKVRAGHEVVIGGWKTTQGKFRSLMAGVYRGNHLAFVGIVGTGFGADKVRRLMPALKALRIGQESVRRQGCAEEDARRALAEARTCRRDRIRRLDRWRQYPSGGFQGPAPGQAGARGRSGEADHDQNSQSRDRRNRRRTKPPR